jgi:putative PIN family toxin of toxin-antitoxin system
MRIILDTNIWISFLLGRRLSEIRRIVTDVRFDVVVCPQLIGEIIDVSSRDKIRKHVPSTDVSNLLRIIRAFCHFVEIEIEAVSDIRDSKDLYLLSLAETVDALYIVSGDTDLTTLGKHGNTRIITLAEFRDLYLK